MGEMLSADCECGFFIGMNSGSGFFLPTPDENGIVHEKVIEPAACFECGELYGMNICSKTSRCPNCRKRVIFYKTNRFFSDAKPEDMDDNIVPYIEGQNEPIRYLCPRCGQKKLVFHSMGRWY
jgi:hypothetical protein